ncbi:MAG: hypothetical protein L3K09_01315, partial [Thermoplasmata archaeon]|nr:hypothetical protein [Thermoplasmata archaeon]
PVTNETVPVGNVTIAYSYAGDYLSNASLFVFPTGKNPSPVFAQGAYVPGVGLRGGAATWPAVSPGAYRIVLALGTPYNHYNATAWINVSFGGIQTYQNNTPAKLPGGMSAASLAAVLAVVGAIVGLVVGLMVAPAFRPNQSPGMAGASAAGANAPGRTAAGKFTCPTCKDEFETAAAVEQHRRIVHGFED